MKKYLSITTFPEFFLPSSKVNLHGSHERLPPLFFEGICSATSDEIQEEPDSEDFLYTQLGRKLDQEHVESGNYQERAVDAGSENETSFAVRRNFSKRSFSRRRSKNRPKTPQKSAQNRVSSSSSDFDRGNLRITDSESESTFNAISDAETEMGDRKSFRSFS